MKLNYVIKLADSYYKFSAKHVEGKFLRVFDFDHTLAKTSGLPWAVNKDTGEEYRLFRGNPLLPEKFVWTYNEKKKFWLVKDEDLPEGFEIDWREFNDVVPNAEVVSKYFNIFKKILEESPNDTIILTARKNPNAISKYLEEKGVIFPTENIYAISSSKGDDKAWVVNTLMEDYGYRNVQFWDDGKEHVEAVEKLKDIWGDSANIQSILVPRGK